MAIRFEKVSHIYSPDMPFAFTALRDINVSLHEGKITAIIGKTGSGKSTLAQHLNALLLPSEGSIDIAKHHIQAGVKNKNLKSLRQKVGLVFQFSEYQLFEETVLKDVAFGPKNFGVSEEDALLLAKESLQKVGISEHYYHYSPLELSGGQKRRVAIAGILAMQPEIIVLDEPTAGLDPHGAREMISLFQRLNQEEGRTVLLICHDNELVYRYCDDVLLLQAGQVAYHGESHALFENETLREHFQLFPPAVIRLRERFREKGFKIGEVCTIEDLVKQVIQEIKR